jgi:quercetin dioxygenase-like cupin family protein
VTEREYFFRQADFSEALEFSPGVRGRVLWRGSLMFSLVELDSGAEAPLHHHHEEQMGLVLEGAFDRQQGGLRRTLTAGEGFYVPPDVPHGGRAVGGTCRVLDVFTPPRERYVRGQGGR